MAEPRVAGAAKEGLAELVDRSADPARVRSALARLERASPGLAERAEAEPWLAVRLVAVLAASRSLARLLERDPVSLDLLSDPRRHPLDPSDVVRWKRRELLRIASLDLTGVADLRETTAALSDMARDVLGMVLAAGAVGVPLAVIGMGKLGGHELNYASDIDILFVAEGEHDAAERAARAVMEGAGRCFRVDAALRPEGRDGPLVRSVSSYQAYWVRWAQPWERQALLRAGPVAGDEQLARRWMDAASAAVWDRPFSADDLRHIRALKVRAEDEIRRRGLADRDVKRGPGGIRDVEFAAQLLQLVHGRVDPDLRSRNTLDALAALARGGYVGSTDADQLADSYLMLRRVEHALQLEDERQVHAVPEDRAQRRRVARVVGFQGGVAAGPTERFDRALAEHRARVRSVHERVWFRPLLESLAGSGPLGPPAAAERLAAFGFTDVERTRQAVVELTRGLTRSSRMMQQLLPLLLDWLSASPDPDLGLLGLRRLASGEQRSRALAVAFRDSPEVARLLAHLLGASRLVGEILLANPDLIERLADPVRLRTRSVDELVEGIRTGIAWRDGPDEQQRALHRWQRRHLLGVAARDLLGHAPVEVVGSDLAALAEASLGAALALLSPRVPFAVVALGRLGGAELGYASDLDVAFVHDGTSPEAAAEAERVAAGLMRFLGGSTPAEQIWAVDADLRPEGRNGPLSRSLDGWRGYLRRWASTWERQAYLRARLVAGDPVLGARLCEEIEAAIWARPFTEDDVRAVRRMKVRIEQERAPRGGDPEFHLKLGRGSLSDIEFTVQLLQLRHRVPGSATITALGALVESGHLPAEEAEVLEESYRFCERTRNRSFLVVGPGDTLPIRPERITPLARSLGFTVAGLRAEYRRVTRRARRVVENRFYDRR